MSDMDARDRLAGLRMLLAVELDASGRERLDVKLSRRVALELDRALALACELLTEEPNLPAPPRWTLPALSP